MISVKQEQLKEMIQSLFELSKSTSGTEKFQMEKMDMKRLIEQTLADMDDAIAQSNLSFRTALGDEPLPFLGDNGKMYRVIQNLVENILKYSLGGTRVYIDAGKENGEIFVTMKNISAYEMNFEAEEMMERFVRGDESRTSEGTALALRLHQATRPTWAAAWSLRQTAICLKSSCVSRRQARILQREKQP